VAARELDDTDADMFVSDNSKRISGIELDVSTGRHNGAVMKSQYYIFGDSKISLIVHFYNPFEVIVALSHGLSI